MRRKSGKGGVTEANRKHCFMGEQSIAELNAAEELKLKLEVWLIRNDNTGVDNYQWRGGCAEAILEWTKVWERERGDSVYGQITA